jgi:hypothetical protein
MRSDLVFGALGHISNRYQLCLLVSKGTRKLHRSKTRLQDTSNDVLARLRHSSRGADTRLAQGSPAFQWRRAT